MGLAPEHLKAKRPKKLIAMLRDPQQFFLGRVALKEVGSHVVPELIDALTSSKFQKDLRRDGKPSPKNWTLPYPPLALILECLAAYAPPEAVPAVVPYIDHENEHLRMQAALLLGTVGTDATIEPLKRIFTDADNSVRGYALIGIRRALKAGRASERFSRELFDYVKPLAFRDDELSSLDLAPECLLMLDRARAAEYLTDPKNLTPEREGLVDVLRALCNAEVIPDEDSLLRLIEANKDEEDAYPNEWIIGESLRCLGRIDSDAARAAIQRGLQSSSSEIRENAAEALAATHGIRAPFNLLFDKWKAEGWAGLSEPQRYCLAVRNLIDEVKNGGFCQYFFNSTGDAWPDALAGLEAIGATTDACIFREVLAQFGDEGPSTDADERQGEVERAFVDDSDSLDERFYEDAQDREVLMYRYMIEHADHFRGA